MVSDKVRSQILVNLQDSIDNIINIERFCRLIPQVGTNLVYAREEASEISDVAAIGGRIISCMGEPRVCGEVVYGGSKFLASAVLEAMKISPALRSAVNLRGDDSIAHALKEMGMDFIALKSLDLLDLCPVTVSIEESGEVHRVYYHPGAFGVEASITILGESPMELVTIVNELLKHV